MKKLHKFLLVLFTLICSSSVAGTAFASQQNNVKLYRQSQPILKDEKVKTIDNNQNDFIYHFIQNYQWSNGYNAGSTNGYFQNNGETLNSDYSDPSYFNAQFNTTDYLPTTFDSRGYLSPQAISVNQDGTVAYEMGHFLDAANRDNGRIIKYNLGDLEGRFHTNQDGSMQLIRQAVRWNVNGQPIPQYVKKDQSQYQSWKKRATFYRKVHFHKKRWCKKHHVKYHSKHWVKGHTHYLKSRSGKRAAKSVRKKRSKARNKYLNALGNWNNGPVNTYNQVLADIQVGPVFQTGHGQALTWNHHDNTLWFMNYENTQGNPQFISQVNPNTLLPETKLTINPSMNEKLGHSFAFDNNGNAWTWIYKPDYSYPAGNDGNGNKSVAVYKGTIKDNHVSFKEQYDLQNGPGTWQQSSGFNPMNNRFYLISDSSFISVPTNKDAKDMSVNDVNCLHLDGDRETEGLSFTQNGEAFLLSNHGPELFKSNNMNN